MFSVNGVAVHPRTGLLAAATDAHAAFLGRVATGGPAGGASPPPVPEPQRTVSGGVDTSSLHFTPFK